MCSGCARRVAVRLRAREAFRRLTRGSSYASSSRAACCLSSRPWQRWTRRAPCSPPAPDRTSPSRTSDLLPPSRTRVAGQQCVQPPSRSCARYRPSPRACALHWAPAACTQTSPTVARRSSAWWRSPPSACAHPSQSPPTRSWPSSLRRSPPAPLAPAAPPPPSRVQRTRLVRRLARGCLRNFKKRRKVHRTHCRPQRQHLAGGPHRALPSTQCSWA
mmetsp:Transcript_3470/g.8673  ORF Transcript_3470/g.8673 Transcript_3470/m.8673 type:complete len:217 (-) Transcript_3470:375-1025(-)